jgi:hypothetical protein
VARANVGKQRARGSIDKLPSGGYRVRVYAGVDPMTGRDHYLRETIPAGPRADREAEKVRTRLLADVDEKRNPRTNATIAQLLDRHLEVAQLDQSTLDTYRGDVKKHIRPLLGSKKGGATGRGCPGLFQRRIATLSRAPCRPHVNGQRRLPVGGQLISLRADR